MSTTSHNTVSNTGPYMFMICRVCILRTNRKYFLHLSMVKEINILERYSVSSAGTAASTIAN